MTTKTSRGPTPDQTYEHNQRLLLFIRSSPPPRPPLHGSRPDDRSRLALDEGLFHAYRSCYAHAPGFNASRVCRTKSIHASATWVGSVLNRHLKLRFQIKLSNLIYSSYWQPRLLQEISPAVVHVVHHPSDIFLGAHIACSSYVGFYRISRKRFCRPQQLCTWSLPLSDLIAFDYYRNL